MDRIGSVKENSDFATRRRVLLAVSDATAAMGAVPALAEHPRCDGRSCGRARMDKFLDRPPEVA
jgi:hypothetical protein